MSLPNEIPLFPLNTVLVPGGCLPLRIYERRYLDMVKECTSNDRGFGVMLVVRDSAPDSAAAHVQVGTEARIRDFYTLEDGLLGITAVGERRFQIESTSIRHDGLMMGTVRWLEQPEVELPVEFSLLAQIAASLVEKLEENYPDFETACLEDANWVGFRMIELLPLDNAEKQALLEVRDPRERLQVLMELLPRFQAEPGDE